MNDPNFKKQKKNFKNSKNFNLLLWNQFPTRRGDWQISRNLFLLLRFPVVYSGLSKFLSGDKKLDSELKKNRLRGPKGNESWINSFTIKLFYFCHLVFFPKKVQFERQIFKKKKNKLWSSYLTQICIIFLHIYVPSMKIVAFEV